MTDRQTAKVLTRSEIMARVGRRDTKPERLVRSALHRAGYRFRICRTDLPGCPDIVLPRHRTIVFVHGCFWHQHADCPRATKPKTNVEFWERKLVRNQARDAAAAYELRQAGWQVMIVWECQLRREGWEMRLAEAIRPLGVSAS